MPGEDKTHSSGAISEKSEGVVWKNLPSGGPEGNQTFPRGAAPMESLITQGTSRGLIYRQSLRTFHCLSDFGLHKPKKMWPRVDPWACLEKQWVWTCSSLTVLNPDFGG